MRPDQPKDLMRRGRSARTEGEDGGKFDERLRPGARRVDPPLRIEQGERAGKTRGGQQRRVREAVVADIVAADADWMRGRRADGRIMRIDMRKGTQLSYSQSHHRQEGEAQFESMQSFTQCDPSAEAGIVAPPDLGITWALAPWGFSTTSTAILMRPPAIGWPTCGRGSDHEGSVIVNESNSRFFETSPGQTTYIMFNDALRSD